jgi:phage terminase large subunit-like protein
MARKEILSEIEVTDLFKEKFRETKNRPGIYSYNPHAKQVRFHSSEKKSRLYIGGNRSGKTVGGVVEDIYYMKGEHPFKKVPPAPTRGRIVSVSYNEGVKLIIHPEVKKWITPSMLINGSWEDSYSKSERVLTLDNGSTCEFMSYDQDLDKFAGTSRHWTHFDEEPPEEIFKECKARLIDTDGSYWITMTPVNGMTWVYDTIYEPGVSGKSTDIDVIVVDTTENPYLPREGIERVLADYDEKELRARKEGKFVQLGGLAFREFSPKNVIDPFLPDLELAHYMSMDHGFNAPTAWLWHAVYPDGKIITYDELYDRERLIADYAVEIKRRNSLPGRRTFDLAVGDPAIKQRNAQTGDSVQLAYAKMGIPIVLGNNSVRIGVDKMNMYLKTGMWLITSNCHNLIRELQRCRWKVYTTAKLRRENNPREELHPQYDHSPDSARYLFSQLPDMYIDPRGTPRVQVIREINEAAAGLVGVGPSQRVRGVDGMMYDSGLWSREAPNTEWTTADEHMGGFF